LFRVANEKTTFADAFLLADNVLHSGVRGITDLMIMPGLINLDFADIKTVMSEMGKAMMGTGEADGEGRAVRAAEAAISNPLLAHSSMKGAKGVLINITGGSDMTLYEVDEAANRIRDEIENENANIIFGSTFNPDMTGKMRVSVVSTGIDQKDRPAYVPVSSIIVEEISSLEEQEESSELQSEFSLNDQNNINQENLDDVVIFESNNNNQSQGQSSFNFDFPDDAETSYQTAVNTSLKERQPDAKSRFSLRNLFSKFTSSNTQENLNSNLVNNGQTENPSFSQEDDYSDVPAFIRRKK
jgi:cell division protein FtsZ